MHHECKTRARQPPDILTLVMILLLCDIIAAGLAFAIAFVVLFL